MIEVGYWAIRGLGAPLRMVCSFAGVEYKPVLYQVTGKPGEWDKSAWFNVKPELQKKNALMNLPYIVDGDIVISQTNACLMYLGRKFNLNPKTDEELSKMEQCLAEVMDLRNNAVRHYYSPPDVFNSGIKEFVEQTIPKSYSKLDDWLAQQKTTFLVNNNPTVPDFHLFELIDQLETYSEVHNENVSLLKPYSNLQNFYQTFQKIPELATYLQSDLHKLPINNPHASFTGK